MAGSKRETRKIRAEFRGGYSKVSLAFNRFFNLVLALIFLLLSFPVFIIVAILVKFQDHGSVFYRGIRLGYSKKPFTIYKFRTLVEGADKIIGVALLKPRHRLETKFGKFLRDTRLDELPQLINIIKGDMDFVGPRPETPELSEKFCREVKGYEKRFAVRPGLVGYSQLFTPHSSPKRIRTLIDNRFINKRQNFVWEIAILFYTSMTILRIFSRKFVHGLINFSSKKVLHRFEEKRVLERARPDMAFVSVRYGADDGSPWFSDGFELVDINEEAFLMYSVHKLSAVPALIRLQRSISSHHMAGRTKIKTAICEAEIMRETEVFFEGKERHVYVIRYTPVSPLNNYIIHQYFLAESMA
ncbi:MAG: sugar transferase [Deltaproteobacteria bacterium]|nr:sugar transferase [Deltaproteobacteria bacterium]